MMRNWGSIRRLHRRAFSLLSVSSTYHFTDTLSSPPIALASFPAVSSLSDSTQFHSSNFSPPSTRTFSSSAPAPSNIVLVKSEEDMKSSLTKAQDESHPVIFYFTAVWCGPCRFIAPVIEELSARYPPVTTFKIDIDEESLQSTLRSLNITSVPTFHFYRGGKKAAEVIGADAARLRDTMEQLYKKD